MSASERAATRLDTNQWHECKEHQISPMDLHDGADSLDTADSFFDTKHGTAMPTLNGFQSHPSNELTAKQDESGSEKARPLRWVGAKNIMCMALKKTIDSHDRTENGLSRPWRTTVLRFGPLSGICAMVLAVGCVLASLGILAGSDHQPTKDWTVSPSTYLAIFTAVANLSMRYAALQGVVIAWWVGATKGSTLAKLHWDWRSGTTLRGAVTAGKHMGLLGLACIFSTLVVVDGPLLQRSTAVIPAEISIPMPLNISMAPEIPKYYTGSWGTTRESDISGGTFSATFNSTYPTPNGRGRNNIFPFAKYGFLNGQPGAWYNNGPLHGVVRGCRGTCTAKLTAPALAAVSCSTRILPVNYSEPGGQGPIQAEPLFENAYIVLPSLDISGSHEVINLITAYATINDSADCTGTLNMSICSLVSAVGEYDISITNDAFTLTSAESPRILALANNTQVDPVWHKTSESHHSTLGGIEFLVYTELAGHVFCFPNPKPVCYTSASMAQRYLEGTSKCPSYKDPGPDVRASLNKLMVYTGAQAALRDTAYLESHMDAGLFVNTTTTGELKGLENVFKTNYWYFLGAAIVELVCISLVAPTYWGWWTIGRPCSLSPLELAKAFESPMLADCHSNSSGRDLAKGVGTVRVRYGAVKDDTLNGNKSKLAFGDSSSVSPPMNRMHFDA